MCENVNYDADVVLLRITSIIGVALSLESHAETTHIYSRTTDLSGRDQSQDLIFRSSCMDMFSMLFPKYDLGLIEP